MSEWLNKEIPGDRSIIVRFRNKRKKNSYQFISTSKYNTIVLKILVGSRSLNRTTCQASVFKQKNM